jgi:hypothetical protein
MLKTNPKMQSLLSLITAYLEKYKSMTNKIPSFLKNEMVISTFQDCCIN